MRRLSAAVSGPVLTLGRDGMGENASEVDFDSWVSYICAHIDDRAGFSVEVETRGARDVQSDAVTGATDEERERGAEAKAAMWDDWCAEGVSSDRVIAEAAAQE